MDMAYSARILADSISPDEVRLITFEVEYPHAVHKDLLTHRMFSRNFQSFRAFPPEKVIEQVKTDPFIPEEFGERVTGMGQGAAIEDQAYARQVWLEHRNHAVKTAEHFLRLGCAKQQVNFPLQDFTWIRGIITATEWSNFFALRANAPDSAKPRPEVAKIARMMRDLYQDSTPYPVAYGHWHLPLVSEVFVDWPDDWAYWKQVSVGRCARVSYLTHDGKRDPQKDVELHDRLMTNGHLSPFEHVATPMCPVTDHAINNYLGDTEHEAGQHDAPHGEWSGNFRGWQQYRKDIPYESDFSRV